MKPSPAAYVPYLRNPALLAHQPNLAIAHNAGPGPADWVQASLRLGHDREGLQGLFSVVEAGVYSVHCEDLAPVWQDSCVELFLQPPGARGYLNLEFNAGGWLHASWVTDPARDSSGQVRGAQPLSPAQCARIKRASSLPARIVPARSASLRWQLRFCVPWSLIASFSALPERLTGTVWRANAYKCAEHNPRPHWLSWAPLPRLDFHQPDCFGALHLAD